MKFETRKLGELVINFDRKRVPLSSRQRSERQGVYPYYGATSIMDYVDDYIFDGKYLLMGEDGTVIDENGKPILQIAEGKFWCNNHAHILQNTELVTFDYLYYLLKNTNVQSLVTGAVQPKISQSNMNKLVLRIHKNKKEQEKIARYLRLLDDKIELNSAINNNLEQQAEAIFQSILSNAITTVNLGEIADVKGGKRLPKGVNLIDIPNTHPYIRVRDLNNVLFASLTPDYAYIDEATQKSISRYTVSTGDVLISIVGTIGLTAIVDSTLDKANLTENCVKVTNLKHITPEYLLLYLRSQLGREAITKGTVGAVQQKLPIKNIQAIPIPLLSEKDKNTLFCTLDSIFAEISSNVIQSAKLSSLRDTLLPKLMSGELDVSDIDF